MPLPEDLKKGDPLVLVTYDRDERAEEVTVSRVGRTWVYIARHGHETVDQFHRESGIAKQNHGYTRQLHTPEQHKEMKERAALQAALREAGIELTWQRRDKVTTEQLRALLAVMQKDQTTSDDAALALAKHIADHPVSVVHAAFRLLGTGPIVLKLERAKP